MPEQSPRVAVIVVNYREPELTGACIASIKRLAYPSDRVRIILVENEARQESVRHFQETFPGICVIANRANAGFARAVNQGISSCCREVDFIALVNNDSVLDNEWLMQLVRTMQQDPQAGCCGAREQSYGDKVAIARCDFEGNWMGGGSVIYRARALDDVGLFDEYYFAYCEDIDLSWRLKMRGWHILCSQEAVWYHHGAGRVLTRADRRLYLSLRNRLYLVLKFGSIPQIARSLAHYARNLIVGKRAGGIPACQGSTRGGAAVVSPVPRLTKIAYAVAACCSVAVHLPVLLYKRFRMTRGLAVGREAIDAWIRANDAYVTLNF